MNIIRNLAWRLTEILNLDSKFQTKIYLFVITHFLNAKRMIVGPDEEYILWKFGYESKSNNYKAYVLINKYGCKITDNAQNYVWDRLSTELI